MTAHKGSMCIKCVPEGILARPRAIWMPKGLDEAGRMPTGLDDLIKIYKSENVLLWNLAEYVNNLGPSETPFH